MNDYFSKIGGEAESSPDREVCGFLLHDGEGSLEILPVKNIASDNNDWEIHPVAYDAAVKTNRLFGLYHSHIIVDESFTKDDLKTSDMAELPMFVYSRLTRKFNYYRPKVLIQGYVGRSFIAGVQDCATLIYDYYEKEFGVLLPWFARTPEVIKAGYGDIEKFFEREMVRVNGEPQRHDLLVFSIGNIQNHAAVFLGDNYMSHQLMGRKSDVQMLTPNWQNNLTKILRLR